MAAAETVREVPSALCSEFLNFSAKDTAAVGDSSINTIKSVSSMEPCTVNGDLFCGRGEFCVFLAPRLGLFCSVLSC